MLLLLIYSATGTVEPFQALLEKVLFFTKGGWIFVVASFSEFSMVGLSMCLMFLLSMVTG